MTQVERRIEVCDYLCLDDPQPVPIIVRTDRNAKVLGNPLRDLFVARRVQSSAADGYETVAL